MQHILRHQGFNLFVAQADNIHRFAAGKVNQPLRALGFAHDAARAARHRFADFAFHRAAAHRAAFRQPESGMLRLLPFAQQIHVAHRAAFQHHAHHFGNHIARAAHHHGIALANIFARHFVLVMQRGVGYGYTAHKHGFQPRHGRDRPRASHLHINRFNRGQGFFGGEFVRNRPARRTRHKAQHLLLPQIVHFHHHAVNFIRQAGALLRHGFVKIQHFADMGAHTNLRLRLAKPQPRQQFNLLRMVFRLPKRRAQTRDAVAKKMQFALRRNRRIKLAQAACCGIARIGKRLLPRVQLAGIERGKIRFQHQHFAAHFNQIRHFVAAQLQGNIAHGFDVFGYILARCAIAARGSLNQNAVLIQQANRQAVKFWFNNVFGLRCAQILAHAFVKREHFGVVKRARFIIARRKRIRQR